MEDDVVFEDENARRDIGMSVGQKAGEEKDSYITSLFMKLGFKSRSVANIAMIVFALIMFLVSFYFFGFFG